MFDPGTSSASKPSVNTHSTTCAGQQRIAGYHSQWPSEAFYLGGVVVLVALLVVAQTTAVPRTPLLGRIGVVVGNTDIVDGVFELVAFR